MTRWTAWMCSCWKDQFFIAQVCTCSVEIWSSWLGGAVLPFVKFRPKEVNMTRDGPLDGSSFDQPRRQALVDWWTQLELSGDCGRTTWEVLDPIRDRVTACLGLSPPQIDMAEHLTALALWLITGDEMI